MHNIDEMIKKYNSMIYKIAFTYMNNKYDSEDIFQEVFLKYIKIKPHFVDEEHEKAWFIRVTINMCLSVKRSAWFRKRVSFQEIEEDIKKEEENKVLEEVLMLPDKYKIVIFLYYYEEYTTKEIAAILKKKVSTIQTHLYRGRALLEKRLKADK